MGRVMENLLGYLLMMAIGLGYWFTRSRMLGYEKWIAKRTAKNRTAEYSHGAIRYWWDLGITILWCGIATWSFLRGL